MVRHDRGGIDRAGFIAVNAVADVHHKLRFFGNLFEHT